SRDAQKHCYDFESNDFIGNDAVEYAENDGEKRRPERVHGYHEPAFCPMTASVHDVYAIAMDGVFGDEEENENYNCIESIRKETDGKGLEPVFVHQDRLVLLDKTPRNLARKRGDDKHLLSQRMPWEREIEPYEPARHRDFSRRGHRKRHVPRHDFLYFPAKRLEPAYEAFV